MANKKKILFVTYGGGHARMLVPVVNLLLEKHNIEVYVLALTTAALEFKSSKAHIFGYKSFFKDDPKVEHYGQLLTKKLEKIVDLEETVAYLGANYLDLVNKYGEKKAEKLYESGGRQSFEPLEPLRKILNTIQPDFVVSTNAPRSEKASIQVARELGIKSAALIDMFAIRCEPWFSKSNFSDKILVLSESVKDYLIEKGRAEKSIVVTGNPAFDEMAKYYEKNKRALIDKRLNSPFTVLWASQIEPEYNVEMGTHGNPNLPISLEKHILEIFVKHPNWKLIVRNHPSEVSRDYPDYVKVSYQKDSLTELLASVDVVLTLTSTVGFQGIILGANLVTIDCSVFTPTMPFSAMGFSKGLKEFDEIESVLLGFEKNKENRVEKNVYGITHAAENVASEIINML